MQLDLKKLLDGAEEPLHFAHTLDLTRIEQWGEKPFQTPVTLSGQAENRAGVVTLRYQAEYTLCANCALCLTPILRKKQQKFTHIVVRRLNQKDDDDYIVLEDGILDLDTLAQDDILLELPIRMVCAEDCKGLCPTCGCNLNEQSCDCQPEIWNARRVTAFDEL